MAALFLLTALILGALFFGKRTLALGGLIAALVLCWIVLYTHATSTLNINW